ncbi:MAG: hypothetical protein ACRBCS_06975 [Cellvibrionaceae bacterium]
MINQKGSEESQGNDNSDITQMVKKVAADIAFLEDKLKYLNNQKTPNQTVLKIYSDMLSSRENVLAWLSANNASENFFEQETGLSIKNAINH